MSLPKTDLLDSLFASILQLKSIDDCYRYFEDLCTLSEVHALSQRLDIAKRLSEGCSYQQVVSQTSASSATVGRVNKCLKYGTGGYEMILNRLKDENNDA